MTHRWSGWPGAFCLDCGAEDEVEYCVATCPNAFRRCECVRGLVRHEDGEWIQCEDCSGTGAIPNDCPDHQNGPCWAIDQPNDMHVMPCDAGDPESFVRMSTHETSIKCWCLPRRDDKDRNIVIHQRAAMA